MIEEKRNLHHAAVEARKAIGDYGHSRSARVASSSLDCNRVCAFPMSGRPGSGRAIEREFSMEHLRQIVGMEWPDVQPVKPVTGEPICERIDPRTLFVDHSYQRKVGEKGIRQIRRIVRSFCWSKFKPPICAYADHDGRTILKVLDGQHTAIAAASNPHIDKIPVMIVEASDTQSQAAAFVGQNTGRLGVTPLQLHQAAVVAEDDDAVDIERTCERAGIRILRCLPGTGRYRPGDTIAIAAIRGLVARRMPLGARVILETLAKAHLAPITALHIKAAEYLMTDEVLCQKFEAEDLTKTIGDLYLTAEDEARINAKTLRVPEWRALAMIWFRKTKKKRTSIKLAA